MGNVFFILAVIAIIVLGIKEVITLLPKKIKMPAREKRHYKRLMELSVNAALTARKEKRFKSLKIHLGIAEGFAKEANIPLPPEIEEMKKSLEENEKK